MKLLCEFVGTFLFLLVISITPDGPTKAMVIGTILMVMVFMGGAFSGAHYNPAVTLGVALRKKMPAGDVIPYMLVQFAAGVSAFLVGWWLTNKTPGIAPALDATIPQALITEMIFTFGLVMTVLCVTSPQNKGNSYFGLAIGFFIFAAASAGGPISGGAFNPAVGLSATLVKALVGGGNWSHLWLYIAGPFVGAILAALVYGEINREDR
ncbi:MAG: aquaporin family protein [Armatimonadetes bacterium]|nr:aquaporin family protein [Armatimonadota bacterium]